jgi:hypothetical protein
MKLLQSGSLVSPAELLPATGDVLVLGDFGGGDPPSSVAGRLAFFAVFPATDFPAIRQ